MIENVTVEVLKYVLFFTEDFLYMFYSKNHLERLLEKAELTYQNEKNPTWKRVYMKARYKILKRRIKVKDKKKEKSPEG